VATSFLKTSIYSLVVLFLLSINVFSAPYGAQWYDVSEYLLGKVYVKVFFLESNEKSPNTENWTEEEKAYCKDALENGLAEIQKRFINEFEIEKGSGKLPPGVNLDFIIDYETVEVSVEPIKLNGGGIKTSMGDAKLWVDEVMAMKGFDKKTPSPGSQPILPYPPYQYNVADYAHYLRNKHGTDWAVVIFFYDNSDDEDGKFANGKGLGPPMGLGGPGLHFSNNQGRPRFNIKGLIHEFLHVWYAIDEHPYNKHFQKDAVSGYLGGQNLNYKEDMGYKCVMYTGSYWPEICPHTKKQIGWTDSNGDRIPDILDIKPVVKISSNPEKGSMTFKGRATSPALPNNNPYSDGGTVKPPYDLSVALHLAPVPEKRLGIRQGFKRIPAFKPPFPWTRNDITINKIISVEYRILQNDRVIRDWTEADPDDGAFDYAVEDFSFSMKSLKPGTYTLEIRSKNSVHLYSDTLRIKINQ
jgi:hypothetical protein